MNKYLPILKESPIFDGIDETETLSILRCLEAHTKEYTKNEYILRMGDSTQSVGLVLSGSVLIVQDDVWGNRNIRMQVLAGATFAEAFACIPGATMDVSVVANEPAEIMWLNIKQILQICPNTCSHHTKLIRNLLSDMAAHNLRMNAKLTHMSERTTRKKLLSYLSAEALKQGKIRFDIPFNRQQLADYLSVERSAMSAELSKMQKEGLLTVHKNTFWLNELDPL